VSAARARAGPGIRGGRSASSAAPSAGSRRTSPHRRLDAALRLWMRGADVGSVPRGPPEGRGRAGPRPSGSA
jgi:hypothetical protein